MLLLTHRWFDKFYLIFAPVLLAPLIGGAFLYFMAQKIAVPIILYLAYACSVALAYCVLALFLNSSRVYSEAGRLVMKCGPIPWPGKSFTLGDGTHFKAGTTKQGTSSAHHKLWLVTDGKSRLVLSGRSLEQVEGWAEEFNRKLSLC